MITLEKKNNSYNIFCKGQQLGKLELYVNPNHMKNCYVRVELNRLETSFSAELWTKLKMILKRPLQVMVDSTNVEMIEFLTAGGFVCKRKCFEVDDSKEDYIGGDGNTELYYCAVNNQEYEACCRMMYRHYLNTHKGINPWTAGYSAFRAKMPKLAVYLKRIILL